MKERRMRLISLLVVGGLGLLWVGYLLEGMVRSSGGNSRNQVEVPTTSGRNFSAAEANAAAAFCQKVIETGETGDLVRFRKMLAALSQEDEEHLLQELSGKFHDDPEKMGPLVQAMSQAIYAEDQNRAFDFMLRFARAQPLLDIERSLYAQSLDKDPSAVFAYFTTHLEETLYDSGPQLEQVAAIYNQEKKEELGQWVAWLDQLDSENQWDLVRAGLEGTARHAAPENRPELLKRFVEKAVSDEKFWQLPATLIGAQVSDEPAMAMENLRELPGGPWKVRALQGFLYHIGSEHPLIGVELMADPHFMDRFTQGWKIEDGEMVVSEGLAGEASDREAFFDRALGSLLESVIVSEPEVVIESAASFYDPELRKIYQEFASSLISGEASQSNLRAAQQQPSAKAGR